MEQSSKATSLFRKDEINLFEIFRIVLRRKKILIFSIILTLILSFIYNKFAEPVYEATVLLKKENDQDKSGFKDLRDIVFAQSGDEIATEMEIVQTQNVLKKVVDELKLILSINKIEIPGQKTIEIEESIVEYEKNYINGSFGNKDFPVFTEIEADEKHEKGQYYITKINKNTFSLYNSVENNLIQVQQADSVVNFKTATFQLTFIWPEVGTNSKVHFEIDNVFNSIDKLSRSISLDHIIKTKIFKISVKSSSPYSAQLLANTVTEKFREIRMEQQKRNIRYSFEFVDIQLQEMSEKLKTAEDDLSKFKADQQIIAIDEKSKDLVQFLSNLESDAIKTDLELRDYRNKYEGLKAELGTSGYFDQTFLTPQRTEEGNSPFSTLLTQLSATELKRLELLEKRKETHPDVMALDEQIKEIKSKLSNFNQNTLTSYEIIINSLTDKKNKLDELIARYEKRIEDLPARETRLAELLRQKKVYEKIFNLLLDEREAMRMAELSKLQDIVVVDSAREPIKPVSPKKMLNMVAGLFLGIVLGLLAVFGTEFRNKKILNLDEVEKEYQFPILGIIPHYTKEIQNKIDNSTSYRERLITMMDDLDGFKESYRVLKTKIASKLLLATLTRPIYGS